MSDQRHDDSPLFTDSRGIPSLFDVVVPGDRMRAAGCRLSDEAVPAASPAEPARSGLAAEEYLQERIRRAVEMALPPAMERAAREIPGLLGGDAASRRGHGDDPG